MRYLLFALTLCSCGPSRDLSGRYHSRFAELFMFGTTIRLKPDHSMQYVFKGDMLYDSTTGRYRVYGRKLYVEFDKEIPDTNKLYYRFDNMPQRYAYVKGDTIAYKKLFYIGRNKLFPAYSATGKKITRDKAYRKRRKYWLFGSRIYMKRFYYKKTR